MKDFPAGFQGTSPFATLLRESADVVYRFRLRPEPGVDYLSPSTEALLGYRPEEFHDLQLVFRIVHPDDRWMIEQLMSPTADVSEPLTFRCRTRSGETVWVQAADVPVVDEAGAIVAREGIVRDVTKQVEALALLDRQSRELAETQEMARLWSWSWVLETGEVSTSDEFLRALGLRRGDIEWTFESLIQLVDPEDVPDLQAAIEGCILDGVPMNVEFRIRRPDGEQMWGHARGEAIKNEMGRVVRLMGTLLDVTDRKLAELATLESEGRYAATMESAPDGVVSVDASGRIVFLNDQALQLFGYAREELLGEPVEMLLPRDRRGAHLGHRTNYMAAPSSRPMGSGIDLAARRKDGSEFPVDVSLSAIEHRGEMLVTAFVRDITERKKVERASQELRDTEARRQQALEINDRVLQGIAAAAYALDAGDRASASRSIDASLDAARRMMADLLALGGGATTLSPGDLVRAEPATLSNLPARATPSNNGAHPIRVVLADDTEDIRLLMRHSLGALPEFDIVAEAADGREAVAVATQERPDVVLLDLAMPVMDGLQAIPEIRREIPDTRIVVLSGYSRDAAGAAAVDAGAAAYFEKGRPTEDLARLLLEVCDREREQSAPAPAVHAGDFESGDELNLFLSTYSHEMRNAATMISGVALTLRDRLDTLEPHTLEQLLGSLERNAVQVSLLVEAFSDANRVNIDDVVLHKEDVNVAALVREATADAEALTRDHAVVVAAAENLRARVDPVRIRQVVTNLLANAGKFSAPGTRIEVAVRASGSDVEVTVSDQGPGIPEEVAERIFERFTRLGDNASGLGLGLYIARGIASAHGGDLVLKDSSGAGSTFALRVPRA